MCKCGLCGPVSHSEAEFEASYGRENRLLRVCRWCEQDLTLFGVRLNQVVRLEASKHVHRISLSLVVLGPVYSLLLEASA